MTCNGKPVNETSGGVLQQQQQQELLKKAKSDSLMSGLPCLPLPLFLYSCLHLNESLSVCSGVVLNVTCNDRQLNETGGGEQEK